MLKPSANGFRPGAERLVPTNGEVQLMNDIERALEACRDAVDELLAAAVRVEHVWTEPVSPGEWSPSQVTEHVARALGGSANTAAGRPNLFPTFPRFLHPVARTFFFTRVLRQSAFPRAKTTRAMNPASGPATPSDARVRLEDALAEFACACRGCATGSELVRTTIFGTVTPIDYVRFQELPVRHHTAQMIRRT
jgi:hypothetical protein